MSTAYKPPQRTVRCRILTSRGWLAGDLHLPPRGHLVDFLNSERDFLTLTNVVVGDEKLAEFFGIRKSAAWVVAPPQDEAMLTTQPTARTEEHAVACVLPWATIRGQLKLLAGIRVSDFLKDQNDFFLLDGAFMVPESRQRLTLGRVAVNAAALIGVGSD